MADSYRPRLLLIIVCALIIVQIFVITSLKQQLEEQILAARQAVNEQTLLLSALVSLLAEKNIIAREDLLREAGDLSRQFMPETAAAEPPFDTSELARPDTDSGNQ